MELKKILIVEDSELFHKAYELYFRNSRRKGAQIVHAYNGQDALVKLNEHPDTDLILLDINMPVMSGLEFLSYCKQENVFQDIPVIIISTEDKEEDTILGLQAGARAYLVKPFQPKDLYELIDKVMAASQPIGGSA